MCHVEVYSPYPPVYLYGLIHVPLQPQIKGKFMTEEERECVSGRGKDG